MKRSLALGAAVAAIVAGFSVVNLAGAAPPARPAPPPPAHAAATPPPPPLPAPPPHALVTPARAPATSPVPAAPNAGATSHPAAAPKAEEAEHAEQAEEEEHAPKPVNWIDFSNKSQPPWAFMFVNLLVLLGIYYKYGKGPISEGLKSRRATVAREIEEAKRMQQEAEARAAKYQEKLSHLEAELAETRESLQAAGEGERDRLVREAEEKARRMEKDAAFLVEQELKTLRADLTREAVEIAVAAAEELLRKRITSSDQERLAEDYLAQLAAKRPSGHERTVSSIAPGPHSDGGAS
jgi:F-type H+-transporting ATPase subunit b